MLDLCADDEELGSSPPKIYHFAKHVFLRQACDRHEHEKLCSAGFLGCARKTVPATNKQSIVCRRRETFGVIAIKNCRGKYSYRFYKTFGKGISLMKRTLLGVAAVLALATSVSANASVKW